MTEMLEKKLRLEAKRKGIPADRVEEFVLDRMARRFAWTPEEKKKHQESMKNEQRTAV